MPNKIGLAAVVVIVVALGWLVLDPDDSQDITDNDASNQPQVSSSSKHASEHRQTRASRRRDADKQEDDAISEPREFPEINTEEVDALIASGKIVSMELRGHRGDLVIPNEPLATALKLSQDESTAINKLWTQIRPKLNDLRAEHVKTQTMADGEVWIGVEVFSEKGDVLRQAFLRDTIDLIGEQRAGMLFKGIHAHDAYGRWGKKVGSGFAIRVRLQDDGSRLYEITEQANADGSPGRKWRADRIPPHLEVMAKAAGIELQP